MWSYSSHSINYYNCVSYSSNGLSDLESKFYDAVSSSKSDFKDPSSVTVQEVQICGDYAKVNLGATNSFGAIVSSQYVMYIGKELSKPEGKIVDDYYWLRDDNLKSSDISDVIQSRLQSLSKFELEVAKKCVDTMYDETINYTLQYNQINSINKKLSK